MNPFIPQVSPSMFSKFRAIALVAVTASFALSTRVEGQNAVLAEMYGRGVHAYYSGNQNEAYDFLSMAINNGSQDPRAYYFRGMVADASGRSYEAEADWQRGAELEAAGGQNPAVGRALVRFQGSSRLKLELIREKARLQALAMAAARSNARYGEIDRAQPAPSATQPNPLGAAPTEAAVTPPPVPDMGNPFSKNKDGMVAGEPKVESDDALEGAMDPFGDDSPAAAGVEPAGTDPFATPSNGGAAPAEDPFAPSSAAPAAEDPFAPSSAAPAADDPFAPAAGDGGAMEDPFATDGDDPFAN